jgi:hypothetical protein
VLDDDCTSKWLPRARAERSTIATRDLPKRAVSTVLKMKSQPSGRPDHYLRGPYGLDGPGEAALSLGAVCTGRITPEISFELVADSGRCGHLILFDVGSYSVAMWAAFVVSA